MASSYFLNTIVNSSKSRICFAVPNLKREAIWYMQMVNLIFNAVKHTLLEDTK